MSVLGSLQHHIEGLHDVDVQLDVDAFAIDAEVRDQIPGARADLPEQLFVREQGDGVEIALYVDARALATLERDEPERRLHDGNLESWCVALEGVSHFVLFAFRAQHGLQITPLELEIQAEVDKFVSSWLLLGRQGMAFEAAARVLDKRLFDAYALRDGVPADEQDRYHTASRAARRYCARLTSRYRRSTDAERILQDVRGYYRSGLADKLRAA